MSASINKAEQPSVFGRQELAARWAFPVVAALLVVALYWPTGERLVYAWRTDPNYMHGFLVLPLSALFAWTYLRTNPAVAERGDALQGWQAIVAGGLLHFVAVLFEWMMLDFVALVFILRGVAITAGGRPWSRGLLFPILFLFFMFPLPYFLTNHASLWLQQVVTTASGWILNLLVGCDQRGNELLLTGMTKPLKVGQECSGMRQMVAFLALGSVMAWWTSRGWRTKALLVLMAAPIAVATNIVRVLVMAFGARWYQIDWSDADVHDIPAMLTMPLGLLMYLGILRWVDPPVRAVSARSSMEPRAFDPAEDA